jgi:uncharacterized protein
MPYPPSQQQLDQITAKIVAAAQPERVVLFGSQARGTAQPDSDWDIALVFASLDQVKPGLKQAHQALWPRPFPIDLVGVTHESMQGGNSVLAREIERHGKSLYQKS